MSAPGGAWPRPRSRQARQACPLPASLPVDTRTSPQALFRAEHSRTTRGAAQLRAGRHLAREGLATARGRRRRPASRSRDRRSRSSRVAGWQLGQGSRRRLWQFGQIRKSLSTSSRNKTRRRSRRAARAAPRRPASRGRARGRPRGTPAGARSCRRSCRRRGTATPRSRTDTSRGSSIRRLASARVQ
jgi:hypothetical protein